MGDEGNEIVFSVTCGPVSCGSEPITFSSPPQKEGKLLAMNPMSDEGIEQWRVHRPAFEIAGPEHLTLRMPMTFLHYVAPANEEIRGKQLAFLDRVCALLNGDASLRAEVARLQQTLPATFYADRDLHYRLERMVSEWQRVIVANQQLEEQVARLEKERDALVDLNNKLAELNVQARARYVAAEARIRELEGGK